MTTFLCRLAALHGRVFRVVEKQGSDWFLGLAARLVFAGVLLGFFLNSASVKLGGGLAPGAGAYAQIVPSVAEAASYDVDRIAFVPWGVIVWLGTYAEIVLPCLIVAGLFTRLASLAMIGFIAVMSIVDVTFHGADAKTVGALFDRVQDSVIADQRLLWVFPLIVLAVQGAGWLSLDALAARVCAGRAKRPS